MREEGGGEKEVNEGGRRGGGEGTTHLLRSTPGTLPPVRGGVHTFCWCTLGVLESWVCEISTPPGSHQPTDPGLCLLVCGSAPLAACSSLVSVTWPTELSVSGCVWDCSDDGGRAPPG